LELFLSDSAYMLRCVV